MNNLLSEASILPYDGEVLYFPSFYSSKKASIYLEILKRDIAWQQEKIRMFGKQIIMNREVAWYWENDLSYTYAGATKKAHLWTETLLEIKKDIELFSWEYFNACLLNLYHNGKDAMWWHSDNEKEILPLSCIASLSLWAERTFAFRHRKTQEIISVSLWNGSLLLMRGATQNNWTHCLKKTTKIVNHRINLTWRKMR
jgi:alkylated DNA repair dioxygenase AlkB